ncbi:MAG: hypothetical protein GYB49_02170 [Alphaproteobacteria bacterium]|nr:hypothetical protein [Alphaproteobacteria bacterium]|tara:strand:+ start:285 stop:791 length:507 start_codon:yes stop_codon:yes gene_type:complete
MVIAASLLFTACATTTGLDAKTTYSGFDDAAIVNIQPHGLGCDGAFICLSLGAEWQQAEPEQVLMLVQITGKTQGITGAALNIDGQKINLAEASTATEFERVAGAIETSTQVFVAPVEVIDEILAAKRVWIRVNTTSGFMEDYIIDGDKDSKAYHALKRFSSEMKSVN